jgi:hypothetical protein
MARYKGKDGAIEAATEDVGEIESFDLEFTTNEMDANVMSSDFTGVEGGQVTVTGSISVLTDPADAGQSALVVGEKVALILYPTSNTTGNKSVNGTFLITSKGTSTSVGDLVKTNYNVRNDGAVTEPTIA